jgi:hypothetical protein
MLTVSSEPRGLIPAGGSQRRQPRVWLAGHHHLVPEQVPRAGVPALSVNHGEISLY